MKMRAREGTSSFGGTGRVVWGIAIEACVWYGVCVCCGVMYVTCSCSVFGILCFLQTVIKPHI